MTGAGVHYRAAAPADDADLRALLRSNAPRAWVDFSTEREPSYFAGADALGASVTLIARDGAQADRAVGMCSSTRLTLHLDGSAARCGYLGALRVAPEYRHRPRLLRQGFAEIRALAAAAAGEPALWFTSIASDNAPARRLLERGPRGLPAYRRWGEVTTLTISTRRGRDHGRFRQATAADADALARCQNAAVCGLQLSPVLDADWLRGLDGSNGLRLEDFWLLERAGAPVACFALWDQRSFKQFVARGYRFPLALLRPGLNAWARLTRAPQLPAAGRALDALFIAFAAIDPAGPLTMRELVEEALAKAQPRAAAAIVGVSAGSAEAAALAALRPYAYRTWIETVSWPDRPARPLGAAPLRPEVALL